MSKSCTLWNPKKQFALLKKPIVLFIGAEDELFDPVKVMAYTNLLAGDVRKNSHAEIVSGQKHLTILTVIDKCLLKTIESFRPDSV